METHNPQSASGEAASSSSSRQTQPRGTISLQVLEFKTRLFEAVEELHIRKDAEARFEDQISKLVVDKQELEWDKKSLQQQIEAAKHQQAESLANVKKQFQAQIRHLEEEKSKYQVSAELKEKEINNLHQELRSLQLAKFNLEKKSNKLEQKLSLQSRSKDNHLNQLGEAEKQFNAVSRQCAAVKRAHDRLEQNVDEATRINKKLKFANAKQEAEIASLKKELEETSYKLIKVKMTTVRHEKTNNCPDQRVQQLLHELNKEGEMNKTLREENAALRAEKQEVIRSLQQTQQLLLSQTQTLKRAETELQTQREQHQALKQEHEATRDKSKRMEDEVAQLTETCSTSKTGWDKEKKMYLGFIQSERAQLQAVKEAYEELQQKHGELSALARGQAELVSELEKRNSQNLQTKNLDSSCLEDAGATGGEDAFKQPVDLLESPGSHFETTGSETNNSETTTSCVSDDNLLVSEGSNASVSKDEEGINEKENEEEGMLTVQRRDRADRREDSQRSEEDTEDTRNPETRERPEAQIPTQTAADWTPEKSDDRPVVDSTETSSVCETEPNVQTQNLSGDEDEGSSSEAQSGEETAAARTHETSEELVSVEPQTSRHGQEVSERNGGPVKSQTDDDDEKSDVVEQSHLNDMKELESDKNQDLVKNDGTQDTKEAKKTESETSLKRPRSSFDFVSVLDQLPQHFQASEKSPSVSSVRHRPSTTDPSEITTASGNAASSARLQLGEWKPSAAANVASRASLSIGSFPASRLSWLTSPRCSRAPVSGSDWDLSCSQEREEQQSSLRAQIDKIEKFLSVERLQLSKRRKTDE